jgi:hypothetical protein
MAAPFPYPEHHAVNGRCPMTVFIVSDLGSHAGRGIISRFGDLPIR